MCFQDEYDNFQTMIRWGMKRQEIADAMNISVSRANALYMILKYRTQTLILQEIKFHEAKEQSLDRDTAILMLQQSILTDNYDAI